jgi:hypothetical protein
MEGIGIALDRNGRQMFITDFAGSVYSANLDGSNQKTLLFGQGNLTGIAYAELPTANKENINECSNKKLRNCPVA